MNAKNCPRCGKLFSSVSKNICPNCEKAEEETFQQLKDYVLENPDCTLGELASETGISIKRITQYIRDGRLEISKGMQSEIGCEKCGKPISTGRYCASCALQINAKVNEVFGREAKVTGRLEEGSQHNRMHTLGKSKRL